MRLIHAATLALVEFFEPDIPQYAILSHTWEHGEVSFQEMGLPSPRQAIEAKPGFIKITKACETTLSLGLQYIWVDTCCIDKSSSAELTESINSMFEWYRKSQICLVFLSDYRPWYPSVDLEACKWFGRGWTLQELIAPQRIKFYNSAWELVGDKPMLASRLSAATKIPIPAIVGLKPPGSFSVAQRMSWAADRKTTRVEDRAYSLLGLFDISMPMLYGEGTKAFRRLQEEIIKQTNDLSILAWRPDDSGSYNAADKGVLPALAADPDAFRSCHDLIRSRIYVMPTSHTNMGLQLVQRRLFILPRREVSESFLRRLAPDFQGTVAKNDHLYLLEVGRRESGDLYVCIPIRQVGFGTYFRESRPSMVTFHEEDRVHLYITSPHKFLLPTTLDRDSNISSSMSTIYVRGEPLHGALYIGTPPLLSDPYQSCDFVIKSSTPEASYDHATGLVFLPQGIGLEVFACEYAVRDFRSGLSMLVGVLLASNFAVHKQVHPKLPRVSIVNLHVEKNRTIFALLRGNSEEPMAWKQVLGLLGQEGWNTSIEIASEEGGDCLMVSAAVEMGAVKIGGDTFQLPSLLLSINLLSRNGISATRTVEMQT